MMRRTLLTWATLCALIFVTAAGARATEEITIRGRLQPTVEAGGWLVVTQKEKYLIVNVERWRNESWFRADAEVEATGDLRPDTMTVYMEGRAFEARSLRPFAAGAQAAQMQVTAGAQNLTRVVVTGEALVQAQPDTAVVVVAVTTQARTALEAQQENARKSDAVVRAVKDAAGPRAEVKTSGYNLQPQYAYPQGGSPTIRGYEARNSVTVTLSDLTRVGAVIDAATGAGATNVDSLSFTLRQDKQARAQALADATRTALDKAQTIAQALGGRVVRIIEVQETTAGRPIPLYKTEMAAARGVVAQSAPTPIEVGALDISSQVQLVAEINTGR
ncbi:MAG TPA: SIMPL domain-containing protein [Pyrinomonadaceae bacterium]|jgi:hypothetical protein